MEIARTWKSSADDTMLSPKTGPPPVEALINYAITLLFMGGNFTLRPQLAALAGIGAATAFNFVASRYLVFRSSHIRPPAGGVDGDKVQEPGAKGTGTD